MTTSSRLGHDAPSALVSWCLVPVRGLSNSKTRLDACLAAMEKAELLAAMLHDILRIVRASGLFERTLVLTKDRALESIALRYQAQTLLDRQGSDYRSSIEAGLDFAAAAAVDRVIVIAGDVLLVTTRDLHALAGATVAARSVAIGAAEDGEGTNALGVNPPDCLAPLFGPGSCKAHHSAALAKGLAVSVIERPGIGFDLDRPSDLARIASSPRRTRTTQTVRRLVASNVGFVSDLPQLTLKLAAKA